MTTISRDDLLSALRHVLRVAGVPRRPEKRKKDDWEVPVKITIFNSGIQLLAVATDDVQSTEYEEFKSDSGRVIRQAHTVTTRRHCRSMQIDVGEVGGFNDMICVSIVRAASLYDVVSDMPDGGVTFEWDQDYRIAVIKGVNCHRARLTTVMSGFPLIPSADAIDITTIIHANTIRQALSFVLPAAPVDAMRPYLNGVCIDGRGSGMVDFVATDAHKLAAVTTGIGLPIEQGKKLIIPRKAAVEMSKILAELPQDAVVKLGFDDTTGFFAAYRFTFAFRLIEGSYPDHRIIVPNTYTRQVRVSRTELAGTLASCRAVSMAEENARVRIEISGDSLTASYTSKAYGSTRQSIPAQVDGAPITLGFTIATLIDTLGIFPDDQLTLCINSAQTPMRIVCDGLEDGYGVVMPLDPDNAS